MAPKLQTLQCHGVKTKVQLSHHKKCCLELLQHTATHSTCTGGKRPATALQTFLVKSRLLCQCLGQRPMIAARSLVTNAVDDVTVISYSIRTAKLHEASAASRAIGTSIKMQRYQQAAESAQSHPCNPDDTLMLQRDSDFT